MYKKILSLVMVLLISVSTVVSAHASTAKGQGSKTFTGFQSGQQETAKEKPKTQTNEAAKTEYYFDEYFGLKGVPLSTYSTRMRIAGAGTVTDYDKETCEVYLTVKKGESFILRYSGAGMRGMGFGPGWLDENVTCLERVGDFNIKRNEFLAKGKGTVTVEQWWSDGKNKITTYIHVTVVD